MACMEHWCSKCNTAVFDNNTAAHFCAKCGTSMVSYFDEPKEDPDSDYTEDSECED